MTGLDYRAARFRELFKTVEGWSGFPGSSHIVGKGAALSVRGQGQPPVAMV